MTCLSKSKVKGLLYILLRDHLTAGTLNTIFRDHVKLVNNNSTFSDRFIEAQAEHLMNELEDE